MDDLQLGKLIGKVDALVGTVETMRTENSADHASVKAGFERVELRIDALDAKLDKKAPQTQVDGQGDRIDTLEKGRDERKGQLVVVAALLTIIVGPCVVGLLLLAAGVIA